jgi:site-specific DNA-cytosine methylase
MAEAGAMVIEWAVLDAQHFGVPQRRRRVFVIAIFDPAIAERCPNPLLPVAESLPGHLAKGKQARKSAARTLTESIRTDGQWAAGTNNLGILRQSISSKWNKGSSGPSGDEYINMVVEDAPILIDRSAFNQGENALYQPHISDDPISPSLIAQGPHAVFTKSSRAQTADDSETWVEGKVNPTLNSFDQGDIRATTAIVQPIQIKNNPVKEIVGSLQARVTATNHESIRDGHAIVEETMLVDGRRMDDVRVYSEPVQTLEARMGTGGNNVPMLAYGIQGSMIGRQDHNGPAGKGHTEEGDPMFTLTGTDVHAVVHDKTIQYDGYNQTVNTTDVSQSLRIGRDSSDFIAQPTEPTVFQPGTMVRLNGGVWEGTVPTLRAEAKRGDNEPHIQIHNAEPTMAVRRLTPLECERLMGWPDDHTRWKADGTEQADTHRYKQCGNGVASPVAQWIAKHLLKI